MKIQSQYKEPTSFAAESYKIQASYHDYTVILPAVEYYLSTMDMHSAFFEYDEPHENEPDIIFQVRGGETDTSPEYIERTNAFKIFDMHFYGRLLITLTPQLGKEINNPAKVTGRSGICAWAFFRNRCLKASVAFINAVQLRMSKRKLTQYSGNMRLMLDDFAEDFNLLSKHETFSNITRLHKIQNAQCVKGNTQEFWSAEDPYHNLLCTLTDGIVRAPKTFTWKRIIGDIERTFGHNIIK